ncbi:predicted pyridoxal phosphate-dependent enzyme apparently involved in regulation of cell wall biogenesis [Aromatoleum aromaticum EbN1]|uniref:GDP-perosamine synthase n=1 Tax=Aromatoleum aromaticum (strain DSM 19018 / LMG 30748 / EbN1) TaxID=76114 RepID=Q5NZN3_AROAE|nr:LegC family aminotransferase [Aromatoleum aromaticum]CAI09481.1 predicted pyridoxal phosphate-dependent enzyme apparently involved in regulation of cell wall biogenesis [Aromatoleum aromaticum EbN1]
MTDNDTHFAALVDLVGTLYGGGPTPLHRPVFEGNEKQYLIDCIDSNFVSSVGARVTEFEERIAGFTGARFAVATVNGTAALHVALQLAGVARGDEVISQALTFIATCNALTYAGARPVFIDVDRDTLGLSPRALRTWLAANAVMRDGQAFNRATGARIAACVPMHTFGLPCRIEEIVAICDEYAIPVVEDAAESLGSYVGERHTGTFGRLATLSFNGNKIITTGGGGMIVTNDEELARRAKHLTTTAKIPHPYEFEHDEIGYNYRLPNVNAALGCAQMEKLPAMLTIKAEVAQRYAAFCEQHGLRYVGALPGMRPNFWLNAVVLDSRQARDALLEYTNSRGVMTRPIWRLMSSLEMFKDCQHDGLENSRWLEDRVVNLPSSVPESEFWRLQQ